MNARAASNGERETVVDATVAAAAAAAAAFVAVADAAVSATAALARSAALSDKVRVVRRVTCVITREANTENILMVWGEWMAENVRLSCGRLDKGVAWGKRMRQVKTVVM